MGFVEMMHQGGWAMFPVLGLGLLAVLLAALGPLVIGGLQLRVPVSLTWLGLTATVLLGAAGQLVGLSQMNQAVAVADPELVATMTAVGLSLVVLPTILALRFVALGLLACAVGTALTVVARPGPDPVLSWPDAAKALGVAVVGTGVAIVATWLVGGDTMLVDQSLWLTIGAPCAALVASGAAVLASLRVAGEDRLHQGRVAGARGAVLVAGTGAVVAITLMTWVMAWSQYYLLSEIEPGALWPEWERDVPRAALSIGLIWALVPLATGFAGVVSILGRADGRVGLGAALGGAQLVVGFGAVLALNL